jgi:hypothetical protein
MTRRVSVPYVLASVVALLIIGAGALFIRHTQRSVEQQFRQALRHMKEKGELPPELQGVDLDTVPPSHFGIPLSRRDQATVAIAGLLFEYWYVWIPLIVVLCFGVAALAGGRPAPHN